MITFVPSSDKTDTTSLFVGIQSSYPLGQTIWFRRICASEMERTLLEEHLSSCISKRMERMRSILYRIGWKHKASKKVKKWASFSSSTDIERYEEQQL